MLLTGFSERNKSKNQRNAINEDWEVLRRGEKGQNSSIPQEKKSKEFQQNYKGMYIYTFLIVLYIYI